MSLSSILPQESIFASLKTYWTVDDTSVVETRLEYLNSTESVFENLKTYWQTQLEETADAPLEGS